MTVNISAQHGKDTRHFNGLEAIADDLVADPHRTHLLVGVARRAHAKIDDRKGVIIPTINLDWVEVATGKDQATVRAILQRQYAARTGNSAPPTLFDDRPDALPGAGDSPEDDPAAGPWRGEPGYIAPKGR